MIDFKKYFIVGTNSHGLQDTMNGMVTGELIRCKDCKHFNKPKCPMVVSLPAKREQKTSGWFEIFRNGADDYCSKAERKEE